MISLWKCLETVSHTTRAILHGNFHRLTTKVPDVSLLMKYMIEDFLFQKQLNRIGLHNNCTEYIFRDLFAERVAHISTDVEIGRYVPTACGNWDNYNPDNRVDPNNKNKNDENGSIGRGSSENPDELYNIYD